MPNAKTPLPKFAKTFLEKHQGKRHLSAVRRFHRWMQGKGLILKTLTPQHVDDFLRRPAGKDIKDSSRQMLRCTIGPYLLWLHERGLMTFRFKYKIQNPCVLPTCAQDFVNTLRPVLKPASLKHHFHNLRDFHRWLETSNLDIKDFDRGAAERWIQSLADRGLAACSRGGRIFHVRGYLKWLFERDAFDTDPDFLLRTTDIPKIPSYLPRPFPPHIDLELQKRFLAEDTLFAKALFLMRRSGVRIGELVRLDPHCLERDLSGNVFLKVPLGKLDNERLVPLDDQARDVLSDLQRRCIQGAEFLIIPKLSRRKLMERLSLFLKQIAQGLDIQGPIVSHRLRHTYATQLLNAGVSLVTIMKLLGHRSFRMTMRYAALSQQTIVDDYRAALTRISHKYEIQNSDSHPIVDSDIRRQTIDLISSLNKTADTRPDAKQQINSIIKRLYKISYDVAALTDSLQPV